MKGVLLVNLGSPESTKPADVKKYLDEFLMDPRVIDVNWLLRAFIVRGIILNTQSKKICRCLSENLVGRRLSSNCPYLKDYKRKVQVTIRTTPVALAMRYGSMTIEKGMQELVSKGVDDILLIPLYPQFAMATTETITVLADKIKADSIP